MLFTAILIAALAAAVALSGIKKKPGFGILAAVLVTGAWLWQGGWDFAALGLSPPASWTNTILLGLVLGLAIQLLSTIFLEPWLETMTGHAQDLSQLDAVKDSWLTVAAALLASWVMAGFLEEVIFRGFLITTLGDLLGGGALGAAFGLAVSTVLFGLSHGYQEISGVIATGFVGLLLGLLFLAAGSNLWLVVFTHGFIDTAGILLLATDNNQTLKTLFWEGSQGE
jgi:hypothetical protein